MSVFRASALFGFAENMDHCTKHHNKNIFSSLLFNHIFLELRLGGEGGEGVGGEKIYFEMI
jgi:hypothetical protein